MIEEQESHRSVKRGESSAKVLQPYCRPPLEREAEEALFWELKAASGAQRERLVNEIARANTALVLKLSKQFSSADPDDLVSWGLCKMVQCIRDFDVGRGYRFSTYLHRVLVHEFLQKRHASERQSGDRRETPAAAEYCDALDLEELETVLRENKAGLTVAESTVVNLVCLRQMSTRQVGQAMGVGQKKVRELRASALAKLREVML